MKKLVLALISLMVATSVSMAGIVAVDLTLAPTTIDMEVDLTHPQLGQASDTATSNVSGTTKMNLDIDFNPYTHEVSSISAMEFVQELLTGPIQTSDMSFTLAFIPGNPAYNLNINGVSIGGTLYTAQETTETPGAMSPVTGTSFPAEEQFLGLDQGEFVLSGVMDHTWELFSEGGIAYPDMPSGVDPGSVVVGSPTVVGNDATYDVTVTLPIVAAYPVWNPAGGPKLGYLTATGTFEMTGTMTAALPIAGDANLDGVVDATDADFLADNWLSGPDATWAMGDFTGDGYVNDADVTWLSANWSGAGAAPASVPEPTSLAALLAVAMAGLALWRRR